MNYLYWNYPNYPAYVKPFIETILWTDSTTDGKSYWIVSTGNGTGDTNRVLIKDYFKRINDGTLQEIHTIQRK